MKKQHQGLYQFAPMLGPADEVEPGSIEWAERISNALQIYTRDLGTKSSYHLPQLLIKIAETEPKPWEIFPNKSNPFGTPDIYALEVTGLSWEGILTLASDLKPEDRSKLQALLAEAQAECQPQGKHHQYNVLMSQGNSSKKILRKLKRRAPEIFERYKAGEFSSVRAAAKAAGIKVGQSPLQALRSDWKKANAQERETFRKEIDNQNGN